MLAAPMPLLSALMALVGLLSAGCGDEPPARARGAGVGPIATREVPIEQQVEDELSPPPSAAWPSNVQSLRDALDAFTSVDACLEDLRARTPTAVAEGVADLSYDGFFDHVCRGLAAVQAGAVEECDALTISTARAGCRRRLALVHGRPSACPEDRATPGREPLCVAWAARDPGLCRAAPDELHCRAVLAGDEDGCAALRGGDRERCRAQVRRYASAFGPERGDSPAARVPAVLALEVREEGAAAVSIERDVLARGVRLEAQGCRWTLALANPFGEPDVLVGLEREAPSFHLELVVAAAREAPMVLPLGASDAVLSVSTPAHGALTSIAGAEGHVRLERFEPRLGGAISGLISGSLRYGERQIPVRGRFATFVRDLEPLPAGCDAAQGQ